MISIRLQSLDFRWLLYGLILRDVDILGIRFVQATLSLVKRLLAEALTLANFCKVRMGRKRSTAPSRGRNKGCESFTRSAARFRTIAANQSKVVQSLLGFPMQEFFKYPCRVY